MQAKDAARTLLGALATRAAGKPLLVKIAPDLDDVALEAVVTAAMEAQLTGVVATNTTTARVGLSSSTARITAVGTGGLSGPPLRDRAVDVVRRVRSILGKEATVIGVGGVERAEHAMALVCAGADLVQMYTGFIYEGPAAPSRIAKDLAAMVERAGAKSLRDLRG
jgi:dihydroorotate dehydrogenase